MRSRTRLYALPLLFAMFTFVACGGDDDDGPTGPGDSGDQLTQQESVELVEALVAVGSFLSVGGGSFSVTAPDAVSAAAVPINQNLDETFPCPGGGTVRQEGNLTGDVDPQTGSGSLSVFLVETHTNCVGTSESGSTFSFNGAPNLETEMDFTSTSSGAFSFEGTQQGALAWGTGGKTGSCEIDLAFDFSGSATSVSGSVTGTVCGHSLDESVDESF